MFLPKPTGTPFPLYLESADSEKKVLAKVMKQKGFKKCVPKVEMGHMWLDEGMTFDEAVETAGYGRFHFLLLAVCGLVMMLCALDLYSLAAYLSTIACLFHLRPEDICSINYIHFSGAISGAISWGMVGDSFGRRIILSGTLLVYSLACVMNILAINYSIYIVSLFFLSFSIWGAMVLAIIFLVEFHPRSSRGFAVAGLHIFWVLGIAGAQGFAYVLSNRLASWNVLRLLPTLLAVALAALIWAFFPETPRFLYTREIMAAYDFVCKKMERQYEKRLRASLRRYVVVYDIRTTEKPIIKSTSDSKQDGSETRSLEQKKGEMFDKRHYRNWVWIMREPKPASTIASLSKVFEFNRMEPDSKYPVTNFCDAARNYEQQWKQHWVSGYIVVLLLGQFFLEHGIHTLALWLPNLVSRFQTYCLMQLVEDQPPCEISDLYFTGLTNIQQWCRLEDRKVAANVWASSDRAILHVLMVAFSSLPGVALMMLGIDRYGRKLFLTFSHVAFGLIAIGGYFMHAPDQDLIFSCLLRAMATVSTTTSVIIAVELTKTRYRALILGLLIASGRLGALIGNCAYAVSITPTCSFLVFLTGFFILCAGLPVLIFPNTNTVFLRP